MSDKTLSPAQAEILSRRANSPTKSLESEKTPIEEAIESGEITVSLEELFERDPLQHTREDRQRLILAMRDGREKWMSEEANAENFDKRPNPNLGLKSPSQLTQEIAQIKESGLDLDISAIMSGD